MPTKRDREDDSVNKERKISDQLVFQLAIAQPAAFRSLIENVSHVIKNIELCIVKKGSDEDDSDFEGIKIETLDDCKACLVIAQMPCQVQVCAEWDARSCKSICLSIEWLLLTLRQVDQQYSLILEQQAGREEIVVVRAFESVISGDELTADLRTLIPTNTHTIKLKEFKIELRMEMDLQTVRTFLKSCEAIKSDEVEIQVVEHILEDNGKMDVVTMAACDKGTMGLRRVFRSGADDSASKIPQGAGNVVFTGAFATKYLSSFVRSMNRTNVMFEMSQDSPLHVSYSLGHNDSSVRFILAPKTDD
jgi:hypothetical protein